MKNLLIISSLIIAASAAQAQSFTLGNLKAEPFVQADFNYVKGGLEPDNLPNVGNAFDSMKDFEFAPGATIGVLIDGKHRVGLSFSQAEFEGTIVVLAPSRETYEVEQTSVLATYSYEFSINDGLSAFAGVSFGGIVEKISAHAEYPPFAPDTGHDSEVRFGGSLSAGLAYETPSGFFARGSVGFGYVFGDASVTYRDGSGTITFDRDVQPYVSVSVGYKF